MMASSKVVATNQDLPHQPSLCSLSTLLADPSKSITMDDLLKSIYPLSSEPNYSNPNPNPNAEPPPTTSDAPPPPPRHGSFSLPKNMASKTVDEVWKEIVSGTTIESHHEITLEDFLTKAGASTVPQDDVTLTTPPPPPPPLNIVQRGIRGGKRKVVEDYVINKATLQKQRRMIKNRESAARSRERKQAYTVELEAQVVQLEEENSRLLREEAENKKKRFKQLMECLIPVTEEKRKPARRMLRRLNSVQW